MSSCFIVQHLAGDHVVAYGRGLPRPDMTQRLQGVEGLLVKVIESGDPHVTDELSADPELKQFISFRACASGYCIPLRAGLDTFGVLLFAHPEKGYFTIEAQETINTIGHQAQLAMQNAHLFQEIEAERDQIIKVQKEAQRRLAAALHDGPTQTVAAIPMQISRARHLLTRGDVDAAGEDGGGGAFLWRRSASGVGQWHRNRRNGNHRFARQRCACRDRWGSQCGRRHGLHVLRQ